MTAIDYQHLHANPPAWIFSIDNPSSSIIISISPEATGPPSIGISWVGRLTPLGRPAPVTKGERTQYLINPLLQTELVHLCAGPSGAGKTRWLLPTFHNEWRRGKDVLGHRSYPVPWAYVVMDRPYSSVESTLLSLDIDPLMMNVIPAMDLEYKSISQIIDEAKAMRVKFLLIEMFSYLLNGPETRENVRAFMGAVQRALSQESMTILGTMESPKMKPKDLYKNPRQRISGPASWGHCGETIILIEPDPRLPEDSPMRTVSIHTRNGSPEIFNGKFKKDGKIHLFPTKKSQ